MYGARILLTPTAVPEPRTSLCGNLHTTSLHPRTLHLPVRNISHVLPPSSNLAPPRAENFTRPPCILEPRTFPCGTLHTTSLHPRTSHLPVRNTSHDLPPSSNPALPSVEHSSILPSLLQGRWVGMCKNRLRLKWISGQSYLWTASPSTHIHNVTLSLPRSLRSLPKISLFWTKAKKTIIFGRHCVRCT